MAEIGILNVGAGDTKIIFDKNNPAEMLRAKRIVTDMLKRGYALLVETGEKDKEGWPISRRVTAFDENTCEYIIADFDSEQAAEADKNEQEEVSQAAPTAGAAAPESRRRGPKPGTRRIDAARSNGIAIARTAGG